MGEGVWTPQARVPRSVPADYRAKAEEAFKKLGVAKDELEDPAKQAALRKKIEAERVAAAVSAAVKV